jgi:hypothetical protein
VPVPREPAPFVSLEWLLPERTRPVPLAYARYAIPGFARFALLALAVLAPLVATPLGERGGTFPEGMCRETEGPEPRGTDFLGQGLVPE